MKLTLDLNDGDLVLIQQIESFLKTDAGTYMLDYMRAKREEIIKLGAKANSETHWRKQQGQLVGYDEAMSAPFQLIESGERELRSRKQEAEEAMV